MTAPKIAIYTRFATAEQLNYQVRACTSIAASLSTSVGTVFSDTGSVVCHDRPGYAAMLESIRNGDTDILVATSLDRLLRNERALLEFIATADKHNVRVVTLDGFDSSVPQLRVLYATDKAAADTLSYRIKRGIAAAKARKMAA